MKSRKRQAKNKENARTVGLNLLSIRAYTPKALEQKLIKFGYLKSDVENVVADFVTDGFIDEVAYAKDFIRARLALNNWGSYKISGSMLQKKFNKGIVEKTVREIESADELAAAEHALLKRFKSLQFNEYSTRQKAITYLINKGFSFNIINSVLSSRD